MTDDGDVMDGMDGMDGDGEDSGEETGFTPLFGTLDADEIEITGSNQLVFAGDGDDLIDALTGGGDNRIYGGSGNDLIILGEGATRSDAEGSRIFGESGDDRIFATSGGDNLITGGAGADQFWIATATIPESTNTIDDFTLGEDVIGIAGLGIGFDDLSLTQEEGNTLIGTSDSQLAVLTGIDSTTLGADNFAFG